MKTIKLQDVPRTPVDLPGTHGMSKQVPVGVADGTPMMSMRVFTVEPGGYTPYHAHPWEHINYILSGRGELLNEAGEGRAISAGDYAFVLPDEKHQFRNTGTENLQFICMVPKERE